MSDQQTDTNPEIDPNNIPESELKMPEAYEPEKPTSSLGIILGVIVVILVLILGGLYLWGTTLQNNQTATPAVERPTAEENNEPESTNAEAEVETMQAVSTSDELDAIEADIDATELDELDAEMQAIEAELEAESETN